MLHYLCLMTHVPRNHGESQEVEPFCCSLHLFKQTKCVEIGNERVIMFYKYRIGDPEGSACENTALSQENICTDRVKPTAHVHLSVPF